MAQNLPAIPPGPQGFPARPQPRLLKAVPSTTKVVRCPAAQGPQSHVTLQWCKDIPVKDTTQRTLSPLNEPLGLCKEDVRGQKVEETIVLPPGSSNLPLLPGGVFDSQVLLRSGRLTYLKWDQRKPYGLHAEGHPSQERRAMVQAKEGQSISEQQAIEALHRLTDPSHLHSLPNRSSSSEMCWSTSQDGMGLNIGGAYFFLSPAESKPFAFSSENYRYLYAYTFDQIFFTVKADNPSCPSDLTSNPESLSEDGLFLREVKYGRRIYVLIESETALEHQMNVSRRGLEWIMLSAKLQDPSFATKVNEQTKIRLQTQDNRILESPDITQLQATLDAYFSSSCADHPLSPLSFQVSDLDGTPVSLLTSAFLDSQHSLGSPKAQIRLRKVALCRQGNKKPSNGNDIHGTIHLHLIDAHDRGFSSTGTPNRVVQPEDQTPDGTLTLGTASQPLTLSEGEVHSFPTMDPSTHQEIKIPNLDRFFLVEAILNGEATWAEPLLANGSQPGMKLRQLLLEGARTLTFPCRLGGDAVLEVTVEMKPL